MMIRCPLQTSFQGRFRLQERCVRSSCVHIFNGGPLHHLMHLVLIEVPQAVHHGSVVETQLHVPPHLARYLLGRRRGRSELAAGFV